jgi:formylglycine-generating enzyme required for sulfatase activity
VKNIRSLLVAVCLAALIGCHLVDEPCPEIGWAFVPAGWFWMGENDGRSSNQPQHKVYVDAFCIQRTEVTIRDYLAFLQSLGRDAAVDATAPDLPARGVLWHEADAYCQWASLRLPTEAEWEKAARGDDGLRYPWGLEWQIGFANTIEHGQVDVLPVGGLLEGASPYGALNMSGNVAEWVADYYAADYYAGSPQVNPRGPEQVLDHVLRGGSYASTAHEATTYFRDSSHSARPNPRAGFRCAVSVYKK